MSKFHKIPIFLIIALVLIFTLASCGKKDSCPQEFKTFADECFANEKTMQVISSGGLDVSDEAMKVIAGLYSDRDYDEIRSYLYDNVYSLGYIK